MKREDLMKVYQPKEELEMRVKNLLNTLEEKSVRRMLENKSKVKLTTTCFC